MPNANWKSSVSTPEKVATLVLRDGPSQQSFPIRESMVVGRAADCDISINDPRISRNHAVIGKEADGYYIRDFPSANGTFVNGTRINRVLLHDQDTIRVGASTIQVLLPSSDPIYQPLTPALSAPSLTKPVTDALYGRPGSAGLEHYLTVFGLESDDQNPSLTEYRKRAMRLAVLFDVSRTLQQRWQDGQVLTQVATTLLTHLGAQNFVLARYFGSSDTSAEFEVIHTHSRLAYNGPSTGHLTSRTFARTAVEKRIGLVTNDPAAESFLGSANSVIFSTARALMCVPMVVDDDVLGVVEVSSVNPTHQFGEADLDLLTVAATQIGAALRSRWLAEHRERVIEELKAAKEQVLLYQRQREDGIEGLIRKEQLVMLQVFARKMVHELRNTLGPVNSIHTLKTRFPNDAIVEGIVDDILDSSQSALDLADELYTYATSDHQVEHALEPTDVVLAMRSVLRYLRWDPDVFERRVNISIDTTSSPTIVAHRRRLRQVIINLVRNAAQAMREPGGRVTLHIDQDDDFGIIKVSDNGPGMPLDIAVQVFDPGFTTKREHGGMGVGLEICRSIIQSFGGSIVCETWPGRGTTFILKIPRDDSASTPPLGESLRVNRQSLK